MATKLLPTCKQARVRLREQQAWMKARGPYLTDYTTRYGSKYDRQHHGEGGEEIYAADIAALTVARREYDEALKRDERKARQGATRVMPRVL
jgi:hypothetical protein